MEPGKTRKIVSIVIGVILSIAIVLVGFSMLQNVFTRASDTAPSEVKPDDITQNSAKVTWTTKIESQGLVAYGTSPASLSFNAPEATATTSHSVELTLLSPGTTYYYKIIIGGKDYLMDPDNSFPWQFTTLATQTSQPSNISPTPVASPTTAPATQFTGTCPETTDCNSIKDKIGKGCETQDYFKCVRKLTGTPTPTP